MDGVLLLLVVAIVVVAAYVWFKRPKKLDLSVLPPHFIVADIETTGSILTSTRLSRSRQLG